MARRTLRSSIHDLISIAVFSSVSLRSWPTKVGLPPREITPLVVTYRSAYCDVPYITSVYASEPLNRIDGLHRCCVLFYVNENGLLPQVLEVVRSLLVPSLCLGHKYTGLRAMRHNRTTSRLTRYRGRIYKFLAKMCAMMSH